MYVRELWLVFVSYMHVRKLWSDVSQIISVHMICDLQDNSTWLGGKGDIDDCNSNSNYLLRTIGGLRHGWVIRFKYLSVIFDNGTRGPDWSTIFIALVIQQ